MLVFTSPKFGFSISRFLVTMVWTLLILATTSVLAPRFPSLVAVTIPYESGNGCIDQ